MVTESSPHYACGQILFSLKNSRLNYIVQETPYSAFITIRKKFIKEVSENVGNVSEIDKPTKEIVELKDKNNTLEKKLGLVTFDFEEIEVKYEALAKENERLEEQIDNLNEAKRNITAELDSVLKENSNFRAEISKIDKQKTSSNLDKSTIKNELQEKSDLVEILEHTLKNKESEIERLREELS